MTERVSKRCLPDVQAIASKLISDVLHLHQRGLVHCDVKPRNYLRFQGKVGWRLTDLDAASPRGKAVD